MKKADRKKTVCVIGQGFVGLPMSIAISSAKNKNRENYFNVIGIEKNNIKGNFIKNKINSGILTINCSEKNKFYFNNKNILKKNYV